MQRWFLSYHSPDEALAEQLRAAIQRKDGDVHVFFAPTNLRAGGRWAPALAEAITDATAFVLLATDRGIGRWQEIEYDAAFDKHVNSPDFPVVLMLLEGQAAPRLSFLKQLHWIVTPDPTSERDVARLIDAVKSGRDATLGKRWLYTSPYRGLSAMEEKDSDYFFGRERETVEVLSALAAGPARLPVLLGNSGVGKSSLAQAGVIAALRRQAWPERMTSAGIWPAAFKDSRGWCFLTFKPGAEPIKALVEIFLRTWQYDATDPQWEERQKGWVDRLSDGRASLGGLLDATERRYEQIGQPKPQVFFLYVDQGEELYVRGGRQRRRFSELLAQAIADPRLVALMSMRSDFLGHLQNDEPLFAVHRKIDVPPLREAELSRVVREPAQQLSARFESEELTAIITRRTLEDSAKDVGALPLLSYTLDDMWTEMVRRGDGVLRLPAGAFELGGVLAERANAFLARNPNSEGALRRVLTIRLATVRKEGDPTRRRARRSEFSDDEWRLVTELADHPNRLLVTATPEGGDTYAEVAHEAIFRRWDKLLDWINLEREFLAWKTTLDDERRRWGEAPEASKHDALLLGLALAQAQGWLVQRGQDLSKADREFIDLSQKAESERREAGRQLEIQRVKAEEEVARLSAEAEAQAHRERAAREAVARLQAEKEAREQKGRAVAEEVARLRAEQEAREQRERADAAVKLNRRRYYWISAAAAAIICVFLLFLGYSAYQDSQERLSLQQQQALAQIAVGAAQKLLDQVSTSLKRGDITSKGAADMLNAVTDIVQQVRRTDTPQTIELLANLGQTASDLQSILGQFDQAYDSAKSAKDLVEPASRSDPNNAKKLELLYSSIWRMGDAFADRSLDEADQRKALELYREAEGLARRGVEVTSGDGGGQHNLAVVLGRIGDAYQGLRHWGSAMAVYSEALAIMQAVVAAQPQNKLWQRDLANMISRMGQVLERSQNLDAAMKQFEAALEIRKRLVAEDRNNDSLQHNEAISHREIARLYGRRGERTKSVDSYRHAVDILENLRIKDPINAAWLNALAPWYAEYGALLKDQDKVDALEQYRKAYALRRELALRDPTKPDRQVAFARAGRSLANLLYEQNRELDETVKLHRESIEILDDLRPNYDQDVFRSYMSVGNIQKARTDPEGALKEYERASGIARESVLRDQASVSWQENLAESLAKIAEILIEQGRTSQALDHYRRALEFVQAVAAPHPENAAWAAFVGSLKAKTQSLEPKP
jgi:tetratricopeptide (TPR) repeat protein